MRSRLKSSRFWPLVVIALVAALLVAVPGLAAVDDSYSKVLLHFDGADASTTITDESGKTWTAYGNAQVDTAQSVFGGSSVLLDGTGDYLSTPDSSDLYVNSSDLTIDLRLRFNALPAVDYGSYFYGQATDGNNRILLTFVNASAGKKIQFGVKSSGTWLILMERAWTPSINTWYHLAVTKSGNITRLFINGTQLGATDTSSYSIGDFTSGAYIGAAASDGGASGYFNGWIDEFRFSNGIARWTSNFTPPADDYPAVTPSPTSTFTPSNTPTNTSTPPPLYPSATPSITNTPTQTRTPTQTYTPTVSPTPYGSIIWADGPVTLTEALKTGINILLTADPPVGAETNIYAATSISGVDTEWAISITNLAGVDSPYTDWNMEDNSVWAWSVICTGEDPTWSCAYYELPVEGGSTSLRLPWQTGTNAMYGVSGVHAGAAMVSGSYAVDFVGGDSLGSNVMPPLVIAAAGGTISSVCSDGVSMAVRVDGGPVPLAYFHLATGQTFTVGQTISQGQTIGSLKYGTFSGANCGWGSQGSDQYHLHFVFMPTSSGYLEIGNCVLDLNTQAFVCGGLTYNTQAWIPNGGGTSNPGPTVTPGGPTVTPGPPGSIPATGGAHVWDGIVDAIVKMSADKISQYLPAQDPMVPYAFEKTGLVTEFSIGTVMLIFTTGFSGVLLPLIVSIVITMELGLLVIELLLTLFKAFGWLIKFLV